MADLRMVHALGLEIPSRRLLERHSRMQTGFAAGNNEAGAYPALFRGSGGFNGVRDLGGFAHLGGPHGHGVLLQDVTSDSDTENENIDGFDSEISTESGGDAQSVLSIHSIPSMHSIHSEGCQEDKNSRSTASFPGSCEECQEADGTDTDSKDHGEATQTVKN